MARPLTPAEAETNVMEKMAPALAVAALGGGGLQDPDIRALIMDALGGIKERRDKERLTKERMAVQAIRTAEEEMAQKAARQGNCSHLKQDGRSTRCAGQYVSDGRGKSQLVLVCQFCGKEFHHPPTAGQEAPPRHLIPSADEIGG